MSRTTIQAIELATVKTEPRVDSRLLALQLGTQHQSTYELLKQYKSDFEAFGIVRFQTGEIDGRGRPEKFALLNEDQAYLLLSYSRNTIKVRALKVRLIKAFGEARRAAHLHGAEYLPTYHTLHDQIGMLASGSSNERFVHMNVNRAINKAAGIDAGQRMGLDLPTQSMLVVAQTVAAKAAHGAQDHRQAYERIKSAMLGLTTATMLEATK